MHSAAFAAAWSFYIWLGIRAKVGQALSPANRYVLPRKASPLAFDITEEPSYSIFWRLAGAIMPNRVHLLPAG